VRKLDVQLLWRWFLDMSLMEPSFDQSTFSKNRGRLLQQQVALQFFDTVVRQADALGLLSDEHFTVDGTLIEAATSLKSFRPKDTPPSDEPPADDPDNPTVNFRARNVRTPRTRARPILKHGWPRKAAGSRPSWPTWAMR
jgi:Transposase domain (DUF772)